MLIYLLILKKKHQTKMVADIDYLFIFGEQCGGNWRLWVSYFLYLIGNKKIRTHSLFN
jgi:hypothetical protein